MDDKNSRDNRDRHQVAGGEEYEVNYLAQKLNVSAEEVRKAIQQVGNSRESLKNIYEKAVAKLLNDTSANGGIFLPCCHRGKSKRTTGTITALIKLNSNIMKPEEMNTNVEHTSKDNRTGEYSQGNDPSTFMNNEETLMKKLEQHGYTGQFKVEKGKLLNLTTGKKYKSADVKAVNFYRFEGISDPDDMSILYAIETGDGTKGTLTDAYGNYSDDDTGAFMKQVEIEKKLHGM